MISPGLLNIRKQSEDGNLLPLAHMLITGGSARLFVDSRNFPPQLHPYFRTAAFSWSGMRIFMKRYRPCAARRFSQNRKRMNYAWFKSIDGSNRVIEK